MLLVKHAHRKFSVSLVCLTAAASLAFLTPTSNARPLVPGQSIDVTDPLTGTNSAERPELVGQIILELSQPFDNGDTLSGTLRTRVVREDSSGTLDFYYAVTPTLDSYSVNGFNGFTTDVDYRTDLPEDPQAGGASGVARSIDANTLHFTFRPGFTFVQTDATEFSRTGTATFAPDGSGPPVTVGNVAVPTSIPFPPAVYAGLSGFALVAGYIRRYRKRHPGS